MWVAIAACLFFSVMMPWAELNMGTEIIPHTFKLLRIEKVAHGLSDFYGGFETQFRESLDMKNAQGHRGEYVYALAIGLAMLAGAVSIMAMGSADEQEKMMLPEKK